MGTRILTFAGISDETVCENIVVLPERRMEHFRDHEALMNLFEQLKKDVNA